MHVLMILDYFVVLILFYSSFISFDFMWSLSCILLCSIFYWDSSFSIYSKFLSSCHWSLSPRINSEMGFFILAKHWVHWLGGWCSKFELFELPWWRVAQSCNLPNWYCVDCQDQSKHLTLLKNLFWSTCPSMP